MIPCTAAAVTDADNGIQNESSRLEQQVQPKFYWSAQIYGYDIRNTYLVFGLLNGKGKILQSVEINRRMC